MTITKILVANRSEIAIRVFRAANELGMKTVAVFAEEDKLALHRFKADEAYQIGRGLGPIEAYLSIPEIIRVARESRADAIHPGYGFLSENPDFATACAAAGITFIGPSPDTMRRLGDKVSARELAVSVGVPVMPASEPLPDDKAAIGRIAAEVGYPLMLKASWGGGGRGMRVIADEAGLASEVEAARREAKAAFGRDEVYLEKLVERARHVEVQILADQHGTIVHLFERDCSVQRRHQKVVERAPAPYLDDDQRRELAGYAIAIAAAADYVGAGTVEFLMDADTQAFYFIEVNPRIQVEHTVTEEVTGIDIVKAQIHIAEGARIGEPASGVPPQEGILLNGNALQCRITTEDPEQNFIPDYGRITAYRGATGFGIRLDGGTAYSGAVITRFYDPLLEKVTAWAPSPEEAIARMDRALREFRIRGVATNLAFLENVVSHPAFRAASYTTRFIDETPELFEAVARRDRATKLLTYIADVTVNGHPDTRGRTRPPEEGLVVPPPHFDRLPADGAKQRLDRDGPEAFARWMRSEKRALVTDTTMRDAHQSLLATRMRTFDLAAIADAYARALPELLSLECWGGATFDVAMRFLTEDPWERLALIRERTPNILLQMLLRGSNARRLRQLSRQRGPLFRQPCGGRRRRPLPRLRLPQLGREHAGRDGRGARGGQALRRGALLYRRHPRPRPRQIQPPLLCRSRPRTGAGRRPHHRHQGHGRAAQAGRGDQAGLGAPRRNRPSHPLPHPRHLGHLGGVGGGGGRGGGRRLRRGDRFDVGPDLPALPRLAGRGACRHRARHRPRRRRRSAGSRSISRRSGAVPRLRIATSASAPRRSISTRCRAASSPTSRSRRARSASRRAGTRWPAPMPRSTCCSATSSR